MASNNIRVFKTKHGYATLVGVSEDGGRTVRQPIGSAGLNVNEDSYLRARLKAVGVSANTRSVLVKSYRDRTLTFRCVRTLLLTSPIGKMVERVGAGADYRLSSEWCEKMDEWLVQWALERGVG